ncbi:hypothetical protein CWE08_00830 [Aliidiomarina iranensis]|uniref:Uncharacterized protein n=1 Tax=Aliidiomarina iranensis TaxID=1434071 RepID=A0A432W1X2_9GAMM|nr:hypothetical protein [Aliidiomarina iranensis]RUO23230.1 hypothetical protein CWE08_00830 [Aliidiomarina iranensis]
MSKIVHIAYGAVIVVLLVFSLSRNADPVANTPLQIKPELEREIQVNTNDDMLSAAEASGNQAALQRELATLIAENALLKEQLEAALAQLSEAESEAGGTLANANNRLERRQNESVQDQLARIARNNNLEAIDVTNLDQRLIEEPIDYNWAYEMDMMFRDFLLTSNALTNIQVENINCRTEVCEFEMKMINEDEDFNTMTFHREFFQQEDINLQDYRYLTMHESGSGVVRLILEKRKTSE